MTHIDTSQGRRKVLQNYRRKRHFSRTSEPKGGRVGVRYHGVFVVQKHDARRLHYDLRLELDGVLKSWAVPKGPSLDPAEKRLAVHVEDHPLDYCDFEGIIPEEEYGAGTVVVWDRGLWSTTEDAANAYRRGRLHFSLEGQKLHGAWVLARMRGAATGEAKDNWLLMKVADAAASSTIDVLQDARSVTSGRTLEEVANAPQQSRRTDAVEAAVKIARENGHKATQPDVLTPQLATLVDRAPSGEQWLNEIKFDGYRILCRINFGNVELYSRNAKNWSQRFANIARRAATLPVAQAWLDGEVTAVLADGRTSFESLQRALSEERDQDLIYFVFDVLYLDGFDLRRLPLAERKQILAYLLAGADGTALRYVDHLQGEGETFYRRACEFGLEGIIAKRGDRPYHAGRGREWLKVKCLQRQEFVVGGYTEPGGVRAGFGALLLGVYDALGRLIYTGRVGTGFTEETLSRLHERLRPLEMNVSPFVEPPSVPARSVHWVRPQLVIEVAFSNWTRDGVLRQPSFQGLREDKPAREVVREIPITAPPPVELSKPLRHKPARIHGIALSHPDKVLYPEARLRKRDLAHYYEMVAEWMLPQLIRRPLTLLRCPEGYDKGCFFQKRADDAFPSVLTRVPMVEKGEPFVYTAADSPSALIALVQLGVLEIHVWSARYDRVEFPDRLVFDLDPDEGLPWSRILEAVFAIKDRLDNLGLTSFVKTTGGKGFHVVVPIVRRHRWNEVTEFAKAVALDVARRNRYLFTATMAKATRGGKVYIDYMRNARGATAIAEFSTRARPGAPVSAPLGWDELGGDIRSDSITVLNMTERLQRLPSNPWAEMPTTRQTINDAMKRELGLI